MEIEIEIKIEIEIEIQSRITRSNEFWGRLFWEEALAVNLKLSFQDPFSCFLALYSGDAHGVSQRRFYLGLSFRC